MLLLTYNFGAPALTYMHTGSTNGRSTEATPTKNFAQNNPDTAQLTHAPLVVIRQLTQVRQMQARPVTV